MTLLNGWIDWAIRRPGPPQKRYMESVNRQEGFVCHSAEAGLISTLATLDNPLRAASWHWTLDKDGTLYQHYRVTVSCWASGSFEANTRYVAMEAVGFAGEPLTTPQVVAALRLWHELGFTRRGMNLWEHNEVATKWKPNAGPTACPSHRYDEAFAALEGDDDMTPEEKAKLEAVYAALTGGVPGVIEQWNAQGNSVLIGFTEEQKKLSRHIDQHPNDGGVSVGADVTFTVKEIHP